MKTSGFTPSELRTLRAFKTPAGIQHFLDAIPYHLAGTAWSPRQVFHKKTAHCLEAGRSLRRPHCAFLEFPPFILDLEADQDIDHVAYDVRRKNRDAHRQRPTARR
jgi:hypothetical protein